MTERLGFLSETTGINISVWDAARPAGSNGQRWCPVGFLSALGPLAGSFMYLREYDGPPLDPVNLDYRKVPPGTVFRPTGGRAGELHGVFSDALPGHFGMAVLTQQFPELKRMSDLEKLCWFGRRIQSGLLFEVKHRSTPERYIEGLRYLEVVREQAVRFHLHQLRNVLNSQNFYGLTSLGGARPKAAVKWDGRYWVAKFNLPEDPYSNLARVEHASLELAAAAGLTVPESRVVTLPESQQDVLLVDRYDCTPTGRFHRLSLRTLTGTDNTGWAHGATADFQDIAKAMRAANPEGFAGADGEEMIRLLAFQVGAQVGDNHLRNFEMMLDEHNDWRLTPAFDQVPVPGQSVMFATRPGGFANSGQARSPHLAGAVARTFDRDVTQVRRILADTWRGMAGAFDRVVRDAGLSPQDQRLLREAVPVGDLARLAETLSPAPNTAKPNSPEPGAFAPRSACKNK